MSDPRPTAEELLAAYASGALRGPEAAEVEALLARDPAARAELEMLRRTLDGVRAVEPRPAEEPDWDQMARDIRAACAAPDRPGLLARLRAALRPRHAAFGLALVAAAALLVIALSRRGRQELPLPSGEVAVLPVDAGAGPGEPTPAGEQRIAEVDELDEEQLAALEEDLEAGDLQDVAVALESGDEFELGLFAGVDYDQMLAGMDEDDLDALEAALGG